VSKHLNLGYRNLAATLLWFQANAYYGSQGKKTNYAFLADLFRQIISLNPKLEPVYYMAASIFPWNTNTTQLSRPFMQKAMIEFPNDWRWAYYRGFNSYWFEHNYKQAAHYFELSANKPNAPALVSSLAARMHAKTNNIDTAINFLERLLQNKNDSNTHLTLMRQYKQLQTEKQLQQIEKWIKKTPHQPMNSQAIQKLRTLGYPIPEKLADGGNIIFINNKPVSSKTKKRFKLFIPPKRQGVAKP
jgi:tetratricopeptide (TPR) repeat protein